MDRMGGLGENDEEEDEDVDQSDVQRRKERLDREQWLREQVGCKDLPKVHSVFGRIKTPCGHLTC